MDTKTHERIGEMYQIVPDQSRLDVMQQAATELGPGVVELRVLPNDTPEARETAAKAYATEADRLSAERHINWHTNTDGSTMSREVSYNPNEWRSTALRYQEQGGYVVSLLTRDAQGEPINDASVFAAKVREIQNRQSSEQSV